MTQKSNTINNYKNAPVIEALIDIRTQLVGNADLGVFVKSLQKDFPKQETLKTGVAEIQFSVSESKSSFKTSQEDVGFKLTSEISPYALQVRKDGFTCSLLEQNQYQDWLSFSSNAKKNWDKYVKLLKPQKITRVAVRYINRIDIPSLSFKIEDYFQTYPHILTNNNADISGFFLQVQIPQIKEGGMAILNQTITQPPSAGYTSIILDIDVFDLKIFAPKDKNLWDRIELLREQKNKLFEESITDKTRELFK